MSYIMLKELDSPFKINKFIYATDLFFLVGTAIVGAILQNFVFADLRLIFFIFNFGVGCFLTAPSFANPQKRNFQSILILIRRTKNKRVYYPVPVEHSKKESMDLI